ncbi:MAG: putative rane-bound dehydrogenase [Planctomycetota bacterium]|nr:putative rane-bound dehydrogenase [Planctomycetota bacterium]
MRQIIFMIAMLATLSGMVLAQSTDRPPPKAPEGALRSIRVGPNVKVELVACEPLIVDPVAIDWGTDGTLWVCEMHDYPMGLDGKYKPGGRIKALRDTDGDGKYDKATILIEDLPFPTGVMAWRKGVLICAAPEILYAEDTDGDGKADIRKVLFRGFATENYQARVNGLSYGLDNWVYGANGLIGGRIRGEASGKTIDIGGRDFRFKPDTGEMEPASGLTQQGRVHDDWGNQFGGNNSVLLQHYPFPDHYARRNPHVATPAPAVYVPRDPDSARLFPASVTLKRFNEPQSANRVTSACGPCIFRENRAWHDNAFICEPVHNLVHREILSADGITFAGHRADEEIASEFLASTDPWFRPVQARTGPDSALYIVDMYRFVIEHPRWISPDVLKTLDVRAGDDKGRIYRVFLDVCPPGRVPTLDQLTTSALARKLDEVHVNGTLRDNVRRLLVHRQDLAAVPELERIASKSAVGPSRAEALATLDGLGSLKPELLHVVLGDGSTNERIVAIRLAETRLRDNPALGPAIASLIKMEIPKLRFQIALSLGEWDDPRAGRALGRLAVENASDRWIVAAVHSSAMKRTGEILAEVLASKLDPAFASSVVGPLVTTAAATGDLDAIVKTLAGSKFEPTPWRLAAIADLLDAADRRGRGDLASTLPQALDAARRLTRDEAASPADRATATRLLGRDREKRTEDLAKLADLIDARSPIDVQRAAVASLGRINDDNAPARLIERWKGLGPGLRLVVLDTLLSRRTGATALLVAAEKGDLPRGEIDAAHRQRLLNHEDESLRKRAAALWAAPGRVDVLRAYREATIRGGDSKRGAAVVGRVCAACHRLGDQGNEVGPDLAALTDRSPEALLTAILDPNREVDARYVGYVAALKDGRVLSGLIAAETANAITLKRQGGQQDVILRSDLDELKSSGQSLMPEGVERDLSPADCADVIAFLAHGMRRPKIIAGNTPHTVLPSDNNTIRLDASAAEIFGDTLTLEPEFSNLGYWQSSNDLASWTFQVDQRGRYAVSLISACADGSAGNSFVVRVGDRSLEGKVLATGADWARYEKTIIGVIDLTAGAYRIEVRSTGAIRGALMDLKAVELKK